MNIRRLLAAIAIAAIVVSLPSSPASSMQVPTSRTSSYDPTPQCPHGRNTEDFPATQLPDVVRIIAADFGLPIQPAQNLPATVIKAHLECYTKEQALAYLQGLDLKLIPYGSKHNRVYIAYNVSDANRIWDAVKTFTLRYTKPTAEIATEIQNQLPAGTTVTANQDNSTLIVTGTHRALVDAQALVDAYDIPQPAAVVVRVPLGAGVTATEAVNQLQNALPPHTLAASVADNSVIVTGTQSVVDTAVQQLHEIDTLGYEVELNVKYTDIQPQNDSVSSGIRVGGGTATQSGVGNLGAGGLSTQGLSPGSLLYLFPSAGLVGAVSIDLQKTHGVTNIYEETPQIVRNGQEADFSDSTVNQNSYVNPYTNQLIPDDTEYGLITKLTPTVSADGKWVTVQVDITDSAFLGYNPLGRPVIKKNSFKTVVTTRADQPIAIGKLLENYNTDSLQKIPFLGDLPLLGALFRYRNGTHRNGSITMLVTPKVINLATDMPDRAAVKP